MLRDDYIQLLIRSILGLIERDDSGRVQPSHKKVYLTPFDEEARIGGIDWPTKALSMIGVARMNNISACVRSVLDEGVPGDFLEAGVWRGGACIFMRGLLRAYGIVDRKVWVADSFVGLPPPNLDRYPDDNSWDLSVYPELAVPLDVVKANFRAYDLLDSQVEFINGWFADSLPGPVGNLAVLRLDGDMYESTMDTLNALYTHVVPGGYIIVDDLAIGACTQAVTDFRNRHSIEDRLHRIDWTGGWWRKTNG